MGDATANAAGTGCGERPAIRTNAVAGAARTPADRLLLLAADLSAKDADAAIDHGLARAAAALLPRPSADNPTGKRLDTILGELLGLCGNGFAELRSARMALESRVRRVSANPHQPPTWSMAAWICRKLARRWLDGEAAPAGPDIRKLWVEALLRGNGADEAEADNPTGDGGVERWPRRRRGRPRIDGATLRNIADAWPPPETARWTDDLIQFTLRIAERQHRSARHFPDLWIPRSGIESAGGPLEWMRREWAAAVPALAIVKSRGRDSIDIRMTPAGGWEPIRIFMDHPEEIRKARDRKDREMRKRDEDAEMEKWMEFEDRREPIEGDEIERTAGLCAAIGAGRDDAAGAGLVDRLLKYDLDGLRRLRERVRAMKDPTAERALAAAVGGREDTLAMRRRLERARHRRIPY